MSTPTDAEATQRPAHRSMADALDATDPELNGSAVTPSEGATPGAVDQGAPVAEAEATTEQPEPVDWEARYRELEQRYTSDAARELSAAGRLKQANERLKALESERDEFKRRVEDQNATIDQWWQDAIAQAPDEQKAAYREAYAIDQQKRQMAQERQALDLEKQQREERGQAIRRDAETQARMLATAEIEAAIDARAKHEQLPAHIFQEVKEFVGSPMVRKLAQMLPLAGERQLPGDPATWNIYDLPDLNHLHQYLMAQAELGYRHFRQRHEEAQVAANAEAARQTYQPERAVGAGVAVAGPDLSKYRNSNNIAAVLDIEDGLDPD